MLTEEHIKEGLSKSYVSAIANKAGMNCEVNGREFDYGIDGSLIDVKVMRGGRRCESGFKIDFQLKSTINVDLKEDEVIYSLSAKNYNDLVDEEVGTPRILILYYLPELPEEWVTVTEDNLIMKNCAWWCSLHGETPTTNTSSVNIRIPRNQILTVDEVSRLMALVKEGEQI
ncbi:DUF4365 domain-containing protein [Paenibacillus sp. FSL F4-0125]|uniref:DUF4365 domain-containing protein n=1 Tax=Paenibacillus sp. FSL F4-0125 TaxID=2954730 RepID=UPI0030F720A1